MGRVRDWGLPRVLGFSQYARNWEDDLVVKKCRSWNL